MRRSGLTAPACYKQAKRRRDTDAGFGREGESGPVILAGPTCDSEDVLYEKTEYHLPMNLEIGDRLSIHSAGAYTLTYASTNFNGFAPMKAYYIE